MTASWPTEAQLEQMGLVRCTERPCSTWVDPMVVPFPRPSWMTDDHPRYCSRHWRERVKERKRERALSVEAECGYDLGKGRRIDRSELAA